jgi:DNA-binding response OmpR family regulator
MTQSILVVDDDPDTLTLIGLTLQRRGFEVFKAQSGSQALGLLAHDMPDLIVLDVMMPQMDGYEVCREIKADPRTAHLPVVMLTAKAQTASQLDGFRAGAIDYITKPVHPQELITRIQAVLEQTPTASMAPGARVIALSGAKGGVGATTLAVNMALAYAATRHTILVDLETSGTAAIHLGLNPACGLNDLLRPDSEVIDRSAVEAALTTHASGLRLLAAADGPIDPARAAVILSHLAGLCEVCVFDLGWGFGPVARVIAPRSQVFILATDADRAALTQANKLIHTLSEAGVSPEAVKLVWINRQGAPLEIAQASIRSALGREPMATIGPAAEAMYEAMEQGQPLVTAQPADPVAAQITALATSLLA